MTVEIIISQEQPSVTPVTDNGFVESVEITCYSQLLEVIDNQCNVPWIQSNIQFLNTIKGDPGNTPTIGENNHWFINGVDTGIIAEGKDGYTPIKGVDYFDGITPTIGLNKHWFVGAIDTGIVAEGKDGEDGVTPIITIGENENWYINGVDSGKPSRGANGTSAYDIYHVGGGTLSEVEFNASITNIPSHIDDTDIHVTNTDKSNWDAKADLDEVLKLDQTVPQTITQSPKITTLTAGRIPFVNADKQLIDNSGLVWDNVNKRLGIGKSTPLFGVDSFQAINTDSVYRILNKLLFRLQSDNLQISQPATGKQIQFINYLTGNSLMSVLDSGEVGIGTTTPKSKLQVAGGIQCGDDTAAASADKVGTTRYRATANASYVEMCMQVGASSYSWITIVTNTW